MLRGSLHTRQKGITYWSSVIESVCGEPCEVVAWAKGYLCPVALLLGQGGEPPFYVSEAATVASIQLGTCYFSSLRARLNVRYQMIQHY